MELIRKKSLRKTIKSELIKSLNKLFHICLQQIFIPALYISYDTNNVTVKALKTSSMVWKDERVLF